MQTAAATVNQMLQLVVSDRLRQLGEGDGVPNALVIFRDDHVSAVADLAWADDAAKRAVLGACRELLLALQGDAVALVLDTFISADADIAPSENPAAREALCALGLLAAGDLTMAQFIYGRHDDGSVYLDAPATTELAEKKAARDARYAARKAKARR